MIKILKQSKAQFVIIGGGMAGLSCASALSKYGIKDVVILESNQIGHIRSSSHGESRMYREMYSDPVLCQLSKEANKLWDEDEKRTDLELRRQHGLLFYGESWGEETIEGSIPGAKKVMLEQNIPFEELNNKNIEERFAIKSKNNFSGLFEPTAGSILSMNAMSFWKNNSYKNHHNILENTPVKNIDLKKSIINLVNGNSIICDQIILTAGMWTKSLLRSIDVDIEYDIWPMLWAHYQVEEEYLDKFPQWFCFQESKGMDGGLYYGFPVLNRDKNGYPIIKVGLDWTLPELFTKNPDEFPDNISNLLIKYLDEFIFNNLKGVKRRIDKNLSPYSMTKDVNFILDRVSPNLTLFCGGSGQAFKFAPLIGDSLARLALQKNPSVNIDCWSINRKFIN